MSEIVRQLAFLSLKMKQKRIEVMHDNEETLKENAKPNTN